MPSTFRDIEKNCKNCGEKLTLNCTRDIERKNFCSRKCNRSFSVKALWQDENFKEKAISALNNKEVNLLKGHKGDKHPFFGKKRTIESRIKQSSSLSESIINGNFNPHSHHISGYLENDKFEKRLFYRSSYEKTFLEFCINDETVTSVKSSPYKILYDETHHYIPDFLIEKSGETILIEIKPIRRINEYANILKFKAADIFCNKMNIKFQIFTEDNIKMKKI